MQRIPVSRIVETRILPVRLFLLVRIGGNCRSCPDEAVGAARHDLLDFRVRQFEFSDLTGAELAILDGSGERLARADPPGVLIGAGEQDGLSLVVVNRVQTEAVLN